MAPRVHDLIRECVPAFRAADLPGRSSEGVRDCEARIDRAYAELMTPTTEGERREVVVCHGNVIRYWVLKALGLDTTGWIRLWVSNASVTTIRIDASGRVRVLGVGDVGFLPPGLVSLWLHPSGFRFPIAESSHA